MRHSEIMIMASLFFNENKLYDKQASDYFGFNFR